MSSKNYVDLFRKLDIDQAIRRSPIHEKDNMRSPNRENHYYDVGIDALKNVLLSMASEKMFSAEAILDFPSGYGRVARYLRGAFPDAKIHVGDIWQDAVTWTANQFRADIIEADADFSARFAARYDIIYCGSLLTHLPEHLGHKLLDFLTSHLSVGGLALITACGRKNLAREASHFNERVFETRERLTALTNEYYRGAYAFAPYPGETNYGRSFTPISWFHDYIVKRPDLTITRFAERGWDDNQDVVTLKRIA
jgi:SAM-dependent methyltransferase